MSRLGCLQEASLTTQGDSIVYAIWENSLRTELIHFSAFLLMTLLLKGIQYMATETVTLLFQD